MDGSHMPPAPLSSFRQAQALRTIFTTAHPFDAGIAGFDGPKEPGYDGGFSVVFDGRDVIPSVILTGSDGEIEVVGASAIRALADALLDADKLAVLMSRAA